MRTAGVCFNSRKLSPFIAELKLFGSGSLLLAALAGGAQAQTYYTGPYGANGTWNLYEVVTAVASWDAARLTAKTTVEQITGQNIAGHLVTISSTNENKFVHAIAQGGDIWIGLTDHEADGSEFEPEDFTGAAETGTNPAESSQVPPVTGSWVWLDGTPYTFAMWGSGEPNNAGVGEDATHIRGDGLWNDNASGLGGEAATTMRYVIEYEVGAAEPIPGAETRPPTVLPEELPGVEPGAGGTWNIRVIRETGDYGCTVPGAVDRILNAEIYPITEESSPVINHYDTVSGICNSTAMLFGNKAPFPGDGIGGADYFVLLAKTTLLVTEPGNYTFGVHSDDGMALRIKGATFISRSGQATVDIGDASTWYYSAGVCDVDSRAVANFPTAGTYVLELIYFECTGNSDIELYWAKGEFTADNQTTTWKLVGNPSGLTPVVPREPLPGPEGDLNRFGVLFVKPTTAVTTLSNAVLALTDPASTLVETNAPYINWTDLDTPGTGGAFGEDFAMPGLGAGDDNDFVIVAKGCINVTEAGRYTFGIHSDDGFALRIGDFSWVSKTGDGLIDPADTRTLAFLNGTADANTRGVIDLPVGVHKLELLFFENGGGASVELYAAKGTFTADADTRSWALIGKPASNPPKQAAYLGVAAPGWTVEYDAVGGSQLNTIQDAEAALEGAPTAVYPRIAFIDPDDRGNGNAAWDPFPSNEAGGNDDFAIRATATLEVPISAVYEIGFQGDDGGYIQIEGGTWDAVRSDESPAATINGDRLEFNRNTGNSRTIGTITLEQGIPYTIRTLFWERAGGAYHWVFGGQPGSPVDFIKLGGAEFVTETSGLPLVSCVAAGPRLTITRDGANVRITWTGTGTLQTATSLAPSMIWTDVTGATSGYTRPADGTTRFFRLKQP